MLRHLLPLLAFVLFVTGLCAAQGRLDKSRLRSHYTYVYQLKGKEARQLHQDGPQAVNFSYFHTLIDSFAVNSNFNRKLPEGHYLFLHSDGPDLEYKLRTYSALSVKLLQVKPALAVLVHDSLGNILADADLRLGNRKAAYDPLTKTYRLKRTPKKGLLQVTRNGFTLLQKLERDEAFSSERSLLSKILGTPPINFIWRPFYDVYKTIRWQHPQGWVRSLFSVFDAQYRRSSSYTYKGYLVTNKPLYQPGDTVRYKAFVVEKDGKTIRGKALLQLSGNGKSLKSLGEVQPYRKGGYEGWFILHDSLQLELDRPYTLALLKLGKRREQYIAGAFSYEDYELKENDYTLALQHETHHTGQQNSLLLRGTNANGLNLLDARVEIAVTTRRVVQSREPVVFVPDTLWVHRQPLDAVGETKVVIPESAFPKASVDYTVKAAFLNAGNERITRSSDAGYRYTPGSLKITLLQDSLLVQYLEGGEEKPLGAVLTAYNTEFDDLETLKLQLPARVPLLAHAAGYEVKAADLRYDLDLTEEVALAALETSREKDSVYMALQNPRRLPYWYFVYRGEKLMARGQGNEANFFLRQPVKGEKPYFVAVQYLWAGKMQHLQSEAPHQKHLLTIDLQAPQVIYPGQEAQMKVAVRDAAGKPVRDVDVTAYAITSKFKDQNIPSLPSWDRYKKQKGFRKLTKDEEDVSGRKLMDWDYWGRRMGLDSIAYYNFLYPKNGLYTDYASTRDSVTQVSPFVVDSGRVVPVHVVYLDEVPVYFSQTDVLPAYAFAADSGYHGIKIRTADKLIKLDSVYLRHGHKLTVSADITATGNPFTKAAVKRVLSTYEQQTLYRYLAQVEQNDGENTAYLRQGNRMHLLAMNKNRTMVYYGQRQGRPLLVGPFSPDWMQYVRLDGFTTNFMMDPGYSYRFDPNLLKMREWKQPDQKVYLPMWNKWERRPELLQQEALTDRKIQENWEAAQYERLLGKVYTANAGYASEAGTAKLGWSLQDSIRQQVKLVLLHETGSPDSLSVYPRESAVLYNLKPAAYTLTLAFTGGAMATKQVSVKADGQTQVYFTLPDVQAPSPESHHLLKLVEQKVAEKRKTDKRESDEEQVLLQTAQVIPYSYTNGAERYSHTVTGVVTDEDNTPLPGVAVHLKGTQTGAATDISGRYKLYVPADGVLVFRFIGFMATEENINGRGTIDAKLSADVQQLNEVIVTGYGIERRNSAVAASVATVLQGSVAGVTVRGVSSVKAEGAKPLLLVDGVPYSGSLADLDAASILTKKTLKGDEATALYGAAGAAGVVILTTKKGNSMAAAEQPMQSAYSIRSNFSDYALWQPRLLTDKQGEASFRVTFPDDVTRWNTYVLAMDAKKHSGLYTASINSFKAMMATLLVPRFLIEGDRAHVVGKALNYLPDSAAVTTAFAVGGIQQKAVLKQLNRSLTDTLLLTAPALAPDSVEVLYSLHRESGFSDGERRYVPIYPQGIEETAGLFLPLQADTAFTLTFDPAKGLVRLQAQGDLLQVMLEEIEYLHKYGYWCSEQAASKLKGLLLEKRIRAQLGQPFAHDRMVRRLIRHLEKTQLKSGGWTWWQDGPAYAWITNHVAEALAMAKTEGYPLEYQEQKLLAYMVYLLENGSNYDKITTLETLHKLQAEVDYNRYVQVLEQKKKPTLEEQLRLARMRQRLNLPVQLDALQKHRQQTMLGGLYWGEAKHSLFNNSISNTLLAYELLRAAGNRERELAQIRAFLLSERGTGHWRNTYESARVLETLLPDLLQQELGKPGLAGNSLRFSGAISFQSKNAVTDTTFLPSGPLQVTKQGLLPVYLTAYQTAWNRSPEPVSKDFIVSSSLRGIKGNAVLKAGTPVELQVEVEVKADAEYVLLEVPVPASCSYDAKGGSGEHEVHREYYRIKVSIFCARLPKGKHTYTIQLLPRYTGTYTLNPAKAELMYFPTFFGRTKRKEVVVE